MLTSSYIPFVLNQYLLSIILNLQYTNCNINTNIQHTNPQHILNNNNNSDVCTKYQEAAKIVNLALQGLISQCVPGAKVMDLCKVCSIIIKLQCS